MSEFSKNLKLVYEQVTHLKFQQLMKKLSTIAISFDNILYQPLNFMFLSLYLMLHSVQYQETLACIRPSLDKLTSCRHLYSWGRCKPFVASSLLAGRVAPELGSGLPGWLVGPVSLPAGDLRPASSGP